MSSATSSNVFRQELDEAVQDAHAALDVAVQKFEKFLAVKVSELEAQVPVTPAVAPVAPPAPVAPAEPAVAAPEAPEAPSEPADAEDVVEQATEAPSTSSKNTSASQPSK